MTTTSRTATFPILCLLASVVACGPIQSSSGTASIQEESLGIVKITLPSHQQTYLHWSLDGRRLVVRQLDVLRTLVIDPSSGKTLVEIPDPNSAQLSGDPLPEDPGRLYAWHGSSAHHSKLFDLATGSVVRVFESPLGQYGTRTFAGPLALHPSGDWLAMSDSEGSIHFVSLRTGSTASTIQPSDDNIERLYFNASGNALFASSNFPSYLACFYSFSAGTATERARVQPFEGGCTAYPTFGEGSFVATLRLPHGGRPGRLWGPAGDELGSIDPVNSRAYLAFFGKNRATAVGQRVEISVLDSGEPLFEQEFIGRSSDGRIEKPVGLAYSPDGRWLGIGGNAGTVWLVPTKAGRPILGNLQDKGSSVIR